jgi:hypothetical protein
MTTNSGKQVARAGRRRGREPQVYFPGDGFYSMQADQAMLEIADNPHAPTTWRLYGVCAARANKWGHARFMPGELNRGLGVVEETRRKAMNTLKSMQIIAPDSTTQCIVLSSLFFRRAVRVEPCFEPKHARCKDLMWNAAAGWEAAPGEWQNTLRSDSVILSETETITRTRTAVIPAKLAMGKCSKGHPMRWGEPCYTCQDAAFEAAGLKAS